jgi:hypothetical protein
MLGEPQIYFNALFFRVVRRAGIFKVCGYLTWKSRLSYPNICCQILPLDTGIFRTDQHICTRFDKLVAPFTEKFLFFIKDKNSFPFSQKPTIKPVSLNVVHLITIKNILNIIIPSISRSSVWYFPSWFPNNSMFQFTFTHIRVTGSIRLIDLITLS